MEDEKKVLDKADMIFAFRVVVYGLLSISRVSGGGTEGRRPVYFCRVDPD